MPKLVDGSLNAVLSSGDGGAARQLWRHLRYFADIHYAVPLSGVLVSTGRLLQLKLAHPPANVPSRSAATVRFAGKRPYGEPGNGYFAG